MLLKISNAKVGGWVQVLKNICRAYTFKVSFILLALKQVEET